MNKFNVLLIDDIQENLYSLRLLIEDNFDDIHIIEATNVKDALIEIMRNDVDLILSDIQMPEISGFDLAVYLQDTEQTKDIPIILITGIYSDDAYKKRAFNSSIEVIDYISKPIDDDILCSKLRVYKNIYENRKRDKEEIKEKDRLLIEQIKVNSMVNSLDTHFDGLKETIEVMDDYQSLLSEDENLIDLQKVIDENKKQ